MKLLISLVFAFVMTGCVATSPESLEQYSALKAKVKAEKKVARLTSKTLIREHIAFNANADMEKAKKTLRIALSELEDAKQNLKDVVD